MFGVEVGTSTFFRFGAGVGVLSLSRLPEVSESGI